MMYQYHNAFADHVLSPRYLHIWAWLIMDYIVKIEDDHWKCSLFSYMYLCGNLKRRKLTLCCIPSPIYKIIRFFTRDRQFCNGTCSYCGAFVIILIFPFAILLALIGLICVIALVLAFMPIFIVLVLPFLLIQKCRR